MQLSISAEQNQLLELAEKDAFTNRAESDDPPPVLFAHTGEEIRTYQFDGDLAADALRSLAATTLREACPSALAYALAYIAKDAEPNSKSQPITIETGDIEDKIAIAFETPRQDQGSGPGCRVPVATLQNLLPARPNASPS